MCYMGKVVRSSILDVLREKVVCSSILDVLHGESGV